MKEKLTWIALPSIVLISIGILAFCFPEFFKHEGGYAGYGGNSGFIVFIYRVLLYIFWGKFLGIILIVLGAIGFVYFVKEIFKKEEPVPLDIQVKQEITTTVFSEAFKLAKKQIKKNQQ
ncbi:hypothetical protein [Synechocystis salina]|uniref:Uncharacterized protein n=1 Tax=Synechocystis salina LEGE 00031 TaxID=1828736 RepID=A0ABR9VMX6_9SYNC|nr:hypothetical protein [Synechocystis salina]MBE9239661.1 hypothetical protein [Synechocystis salina LEGE 00041]MBE9252700.1 hypothetical protein [Synechocystis salina LEGE 00031]